MKELQARVQKALTSQLRNTLASGRKLKQLNNEYLDADGVVVTSSTPKFAMGISDSLHKAIEKVTDSLRGTGEYLTVGDKNVIATSPAKEGQYGLMSASVILTDKLLDIDMVEFDEEF